MTVYRALIVAQFQSMMQYRLQMFLYVFFSFIRPIIFLAAWTAVAASQGGRIGSFDEPAFAAYFVTLTLVTHITMAWNAFDFEWQVRNGQLSPLLLRPLHPIHYAIAQNVVWKFFTSLAVIAVAIFLAVTFHARFDTQPYHIVLGIPSVLLGGALYFVCDYSLATVAFWTTRVHAATTLYNRIAFIFAGQIAPLSLLPGPLQTIAYMLPFGYMLGVPSDILRGGPSFEQAVMLVAGQIVWLLIAIVVFRVVWRSGLRAYSAVGA